MKTFLKSCSVILFICVVISLCGCDLFGRKCRISTDKVMEAFGEYDAEEYDDLSEMEEDTDNKRSLLAGMYIWGEGKNVRHIMTSESINLVLHDVGENTIDDLYQKKAEETALLVQSRVNDKEITETLFAACSYKFETEDEAWKFYKSCNTGFGEKDEIGIADKTLEHLEDEDLEGTVTLLNMNKSVTCYTAYIDGEYVLVLIGYEYMCNGMADSFDELCGILGIPAPEIDDFDFSVPETEEADRFMNAVTYYDAEEVDIDYSVGLTNGAYYAITKDVDDSIDYLGLDDLIFLVDEAKILAYAQDSRSSYVGDSSLVLICYVTLNDNDARSIYDSIVYEMEDYDIDCDVSIGEQNGITYYKMDSDDEGRYYIFREDNTVYVVISDDDVEVCNVMGLP